MLPYLRSFKVFFSIQAIFKIKGKQVIDLETNYIAGTQVLLFGLFLVKRKIIS